MEFPKSNYFYCEHNSLESMHNPPVEFWPVYSWVWRYEITNEGIIERLDSMVERGIRGIYILPSPSEFKSVKYSNYEATGEKKYLSDEFMAQLRFAVEEAEKRGMVCWMYDEGGWPSGSANGYVVRDNPELAAFALDINKEKQPIEPFAQPYPDLLNRRSTEAFIGFTHEKYKQTFNGEYGKHFALTFTDEPHVASYTEGLISWTEGLEEKFKEKFGYDITEHIAALLDDTLVSEADRKARVDYHDLVSTLYVENYFTPLRDWCRANGSLATGHLGGEDVAFGNAKWGYHHILRCLRAMDVPGIDMIWRQAFPGPPQPGIEPYAPLCANSFFPRYASSSAHQIGARLALTESFAIYGAGLTYDQMRWIYNFQVVRGINILNPMNMNYNYAGERVARVGLPTFAPNIPGAIDLKVFNEWAARVSYLMTAGTPIVDSALYMPFRDIWPGDKQAREAAELFESIGSELECRGCDMDVIDDDAIIAAEFKDGAMCLGNAKYRVIYMQQSVTLLNEVREKLEAFKEFGGKVIECIDNYEVMPIIKSNVDYLRATRRRITEGNIYYLMNEAFNATSGEVYFPLEKAEKAYLIDLHTGERRVVSVNPFSYNLQMGEEAALLFADEEPTDKPYIIPEKKNVLPLCDFTFRRLRKVEIDELGFVDTAIEEEPVPMELGDWRPLIGEPFSGDTEYKTSFTATEDMRNGAELRLGQVCYSCEVIINGVSLGSQIFSPFNIKLPELKEENELVIRVSNTMANAYIHADFASWIPNYEPGEMEIMERNYHKDSLHSGLFGPVEICW